MREVIPNLLWIGNALDARDVKSVLDSGICVVIDLAIEEPPILFPREIVYCRFPLLDGEGNSFAVLRSAIETTSNFVAAEQPTLVACSAGISRSPAIVAAVLAKRQSLDLDEAAQRIASMGPCDFSARFWMAVRKAMSDSPTAVGSEFLSSIIHVFEFHKQLADRAVAQVSDEKLHTPLDENTNSIAVIMKHVAGNLHSRWTEFLTTDGEKPWRNRDDEFVETLDSRDELLKSWEQGWSCLWETLRNLSVDELGSTVMIRGEPHLVPLAIERSLGHTCYHIGQIVQVARIHAGQDWETLTIPKAGSAEYNQENWGQPGKLYK